MTSPYTVTKPKKTSDVTISMKRGELSVASKYVVDRL